MNAYRVWAPQTLQMARRACARLGREDLADDVTSEVWRSVWGHFGKVKYPGAYLKRAVERVALRMCQQEAQRHRALARVMGGVE